MSLNFYTPYENTWSIVDPSFSRLTHKSQWSEARAKQDFKSLAPLLTADVIECDKDFHIHCDLPGCHPDDLDVTIHGKNLTIKAERKHVHKTGTDLVHSMERTYGLVERTIRLPLNIDDDNVESTFKNGVLTIVVPKKVSPVPVPKKVNVNVVTA